MIVIISRYWRTILIIIVIVGFSLYTWVFLTYYPKIIDTDANGKVIINVGDVREAREVASRILDKYWSKADKLKVYSIDVFWSRKDLTIQHNRYDLNYTYSFQHFVLNKIIGQIIRETELYFRGTKHPWDNRTWIQYDKLNERMHIYHNGVFWGDERDPGPANLLFYIDKHRIIIVNAALAENCLPNFTTLKYNGTYIKLIRPCTPEYRKFWHFYYIYFSPPYIIVFVEPYDGALAPVYIANTVVITNNESDKVFLDRLFENYVSIRVTEFRDIWVQKFGDIGMSITRGIRRDAGGIYFNLRDVYGFPQKTRFFVEFERNITDSYWREVVKPVLKLIRVHANSLEDIMFAILINRHEVIYLEPIEQ